MAIINEETLDLDYLFQNQVCDIQSLELLAALDGRLDAAIKYNDKKVTEEEYWDYKEAIGKIANILRKYSF